MRWQQVLIFFISIHLIGCSEGITSRGNDFNHQQQRQLNDNATQRIEENILEYVSSISITSAPMFQLIDRAGSMSSLDVELSDVEISPDRLLKELTLKARRYNKELRPQTFKNALGANLIRFSSQGQAQWRSITRQLSGDDIERFILDVNVGISAHNFGFVERISALQIGAYLVSESGEMELLAISDPISKAFMGEMVRIEEISSMLSEMSLSFDVEKGALSRAHISEESRLALKVVDLTYELDSGMIQSLKDFLSLKLNSKKLFYINTGNQQRMISYPKQYDILDVLKQLDSDISYDIIGRDISVKKFLGKRGGSSFEGNWEISSGTGAPLHSLVFYQNFELYQSNESGHIDRKIQNSFKESIYLDKDEVISIELTGPALSYRKDWHTRRYRVQLSLEYFRRELSDILNDYSGYSGIAQANRGKRCIIREPIYEVEGKIGHLRTKDFYQQSLGLSFNGEAVDADSFIVNPFNQGVTLYYKALESGFFDIETLGWENSYGGKPSAHVDYIDCFFVEGNLSFFKDHPGAFLKNFRFQQQRVPRLTPSGSIHIRVHSSEVF